MINGVGVRVDLLAEVERRRNGEGAGGPQGRDLGFAGARGFLVFLLASLTLVSALTTAVLTMPPPARPGTLLGTVQAGLRETLREALVSSALVSSASALVAEIHREPEPGGKLPGPPQDRSVAGRNDAATSEATIRSSLQAGAGVALVDRDGRFEAAPGVDSLDELPEARILQARPLVDWLEDTARDAALGLVVGPGIEGELRAGSLAGVAWQDRLAAYARVHGFHYEVGPELIEVSRAATARRVDPDPEETTSDPKASDEGAKSEETPLLHRVVGVEHAEAAELVSILRAALKGTGMIVAADPSGNALVVSGRGSSLERGLALIAELDRPRRRVLLETKMVEVVGSAASELGIEWRIDGDLGALVRLPAADAPREAAALVLGNAGSNTIEARLGILESSGRARVVSRPRIVMLEGKPAIIESARILRVRLPGRGAVVGDEVVEVDSGGGRATEEIPVGVRLEVTPRVASDGTVTLRILAKSSSLGPPLPPDDIPEELSRMVQAEVTVADGETAVLGGLLRDGRTKAATGVPFLRDMPGIGPLFGKRSELRESEELLVLVTPRVLS